MECPCKECNSRSSRCRGICDDYKIWRMNFDITKANKRKNKTHVIRLLDFTGSGGKPKHHRT